MDECQTLNMGRDILGFPKKIASFEYTVTPPGGKPIVRARSMYFMICFCESWRLKSPRSRC